LREMNVWAALIAAVSSFALGGLWYSPLAFGAIQEREMRRLGAVAPPATVRILGVSFLLALVEALAFTWLAGNNPALRASMTLALLAGGCFVAPAIAINYQFTGRGLRLTLVDGGYHFTRFLLYGLVLGLWR
jgi:hypothetical protein